MHNTLFYYGIYLGLQFNWSEHRPVKAEAAGSSPVSPDGSNKKIYQFRSLFFVKDFWGKLSRISFPTAISLLFFFFFFTFIINGGISISLTSTDSIDGRQTYVDQYNYWQHKIQDSKRYHTVLGMAFSITPDLSNRVEYCTFPGSTYINGICTI